MGIEKSGEVVDVDVDLEVTEQDLPIKSGDDAFLGLDVGVQYLLVGGLLFVMILLICAVTICCIVKSRNQSGTTSKGKRVQRIPTASPPADNGETDKTFPFSMEKTETD